VSHEDFSVANIHERHELADRIGASVRVYAEDHEVDVDSAAERLVELACRDRAALDQAHRSVLLRARETGDRSPGDRSRSCVRPSNRRALVNEGSNAIGPRSGC
jgi:hypothetical protein